MTISVEANGLRFTFPDGTTTAEIEGALDEYFTRTSKHASDGAGMSFMAGAIETMNEAGDRLRNLFGGEDTPEEQRQMREAAEIAKGQEKSNPWSYTAGELAGELGPALGGGATAVALLPEALTAARAGWLGSMAASLAKNATWSLGAQVAQLEEPTLGQTAVDTALGVPFDMAGAVVGRVAERVGLTPMEIIRSRANNIARAIFGRDEKLDALAELVQPNTDILAAADRLGYEANELLPHHYSDNQAMRDFMGVMTSRPGDMLAAKDALIDKMGGTVRDFVENNGGKFDGSELSADFASEMERRVNGYGDAAEGEYEEIARVIPRDHPVDAPKTLSYIDRQADELGGIEKLGSIEKRVSEEFRPGEPRTYARFDDLRQDVGDALEKTRTGDRRREYRRAAMLYEPMSEDLLSVADEFGVGDRLLKARAHYAAKEQTDAVRKKILGNNLNADLVPKVKEAMKGLSKGNVAKFDQLMKLVPEEFQESAVMSALAQMFRDGARSKEDLHIPGFVDWMREVKANQKAYDALTRYMTQDAVEQLDDIYTMFSGVRRGMSSEVANTGGRIAQNDKLLDQAAGLQKLAADHPVAASVADTVIPAVAAASGGAAVGILSRMATEAVKEMGSGTAKKLDKVLLTPEFTDAVVKGPKKTGAPAANAEKRVKRVKIIKKAAQVASEAVGEVFSQDDGPPVIVITGGAEDLK
ncbi:hypothetical protein [Serratia rhizosphaerae]|uniref:Uncharacterized protein n=1 Tax=Serratia rhizosphaerae TaxID=2597702 RepID=A0ABX6GTP7_9GAMM|nr:hypothetical protein [Serratia rhizosphaerae]QHA89569.1 hypothetical protein FO014_22700 [Serratia rhizosphaerae]